MLWNFEKKEQYWNCFEVSKMMCVHQQLAAIYLHFFRFNLVHKCVNIAGSVSGFWG